MRMPVKAPLSAHQEGKRSPDRRGRDRGQDIEGVLRGSGKAVSGKNRMYLNTGSELQRK